MEDLLQSQIKDSCKLALPEGLRDLMCDISREVLRARPQNLYQFIADYLAAMLVARETLTIAGHVCKGVCECSCEPDLDNELRNIGLNQEEVDEAKKIIVQYLEKDKVKEESLVSKLLKTNIDKQKLPDIQKAVKAAYKRNMLHRNAFFDCYSSDEDDATRACKDTLELYWKSRSPNQAVASEEEIKDLYISSNYKTYKNSSLTSLAGSYGIPFTTKAQQATTIPEERSIGPVKEENDHGCSDLISNKRTHKRQVHLDIDVTDEIPEEIDPVARINEIDEEIVKEDRREEFDQKEHFRYIDDEVVYADNESDMSIAEAIDEE